MEIELNDETFKKEIAGKIVVDFSAVWCPPCQRFKPIFKKVSDEYADLKFGKIDTDESRETAAQQQISSIPTIILYNQGKAIGTFTGYMSEDNFKKWLNAQLQKIQ